MLKYYFSFGQFLKSQIKTNEKLSLNFSLDQIVYLSVVWESSNLKFKAVDLILIDYQPVNRLIPRFCNISNMFSPYLFQYSPIAGIRIARKAKRSTFEGHPECERIWNDLKSEFNMCPTVSFKIFEFYSSFCLKTSQ